MQMWESAPRNVIILMSLPTALDLDKAMDQADLKGARVEKSERIKICGSQPAIFALVQGETNAGSDSSRPSDVEFLATNVKGKTYMAMYARPLHAAADHAAEAAIRNLCPK